MTASSFRGEFRGGEGGRHATEGKKTVHVKRIHGQRVGKASPGPLTAAAAHPSAASPSATNIAGVKSSH